MSTLFVANLNHNNHILMPCSHGTGFARHETSFAVLKQRLVANAY